MEIILNQLLGKSLDDINEILIGNVWYKVVGITGSNFKNVEFNYEDSVNDDEGGWTIGTMNVTLKNIKAVKSTFKS